MTIYSLVGQSSTSEFSLGSFGIHHESSNIYETNSLLTPQCLNNPLSGTTMMRRSMGEGEVVLVDMQQHLFANECCAQESLLNDDKSIFTASTSSTLSFDSEDEEEEVRRVSFAPCVVSEVRTRPYTPEDEISNLYYSRQDEERFREEYSFERKLSIDPNTFLDDEDETDDEQSSNLFSKKCQQNQISRHSISRVVVVHKNKYESFLTNTKDNTSTDNFFDSDSFWSGSIAWY